MGPGSSSGVAIRSGETKLHERTGGCSIWNVCSAYSIFEEERRHRGSLGLSKFEDQGDQLHFHLKYLIALENKPVVSVVHLAVIGFQELTTPLCEVIDVCKYLTIIQEYNLAQIVQRVFQVLCL